MGSETGEGRLAKAVAALAFVLLLLVVAGCGEGEGVAKGATVRAYVVAPLCGGAEGELAGEGDKAGDVRVRVVCLPSFNRRGRLDLATVGTNARRATEDSTAVAYLEAPGKASRFSHPILEAAEIPWIESASGAKAMAELLKALQNAGTSGSLRASLADRLD